MLNAKQTSPLAAVPFADPAGQADGVRRTTLYHPPKRMRLRSVAKWAVLTLMTGILVIVVVFWIRSYYRLDSKSFFSDDMVREFYIGSEGGEVMFWLRDTGGPV